MNAARSLLKEPETAEMDRRVIRVEFPPVQAGIAAALRRAFCAPRDDQACERDFQELLGRLN